MLSFRGRTSKGNLEETKEPKGNLKEAKEVLRKRKKSKGHLKQIKEIARKGIKVVIYEPLVNDKMYKGFEVENDLKLFFKMSEIILANRMGKELNSVSHKVFSRDIFNTD